MIDLNHRPRAALLGNGTNTQPAPQPGSAGVPTIGVPQTAGVPPLLLTAQQAADALAISPRTLWSLTASGEVPCVRLGRAVRYAVQDLSEYVQRLRGQRGDGGVES